MNIGNILSAAASVTPKLDERAMRSVENRLSKDLGTAAGEEAGKKFAEEFEKSSMRRMRNIGATMSATLTPALGFALKESIMGAADEAEALSLNKRLFGDSAADMEQWFAELQGYSKGAAASMANDFGAFFTGLGVDADQTMTMTMELMERARDLASAKNITTEEAVSKIMSGLAGQPEAVRTLGMDLSATALEAKALEMGLLGTAVSTEEVAEKQERLRLAQNDLQRAMREHGAESDQVARKQLALGDAEQALADAQAGTAGDMTAATKALAAHSLMMESSTWAADDFATTLGESVPNQVKELKDALADAQSELGENMLPLTISTTEWTTRMVGAFTAAPDSVQNAAGALMAFGTVAGPMIGMLGQMGMAVHGLKAANIALNASFLANPIFLIVAAGVAAVAAIWYFRDEIKAVFGWLLDAGAKLGEWFGGVWDNIADRASGAWQNIKDAGRDAINFMIGLVESFVNFQLEALRKPAELVNWISPGNPVPVVPDVSLPRLGDGGTVYPDGRIAQLAEAGEPEDVVPHSKRDGYASSVLGGGGEAVEELRTQNSLLRQLLNAVLEGTAVTSDGLERVAARTLSPAGAAAALHSQASARRHHAPRPVRSY